MIQGNNESDFCTNDFKQEGTDGQNGTSALSANLIVAGLQPNVARKIAEAVHNGILDEAEIDNGAILTIKETGEDGALACIQELVSNPTTATPKNRVAYLCGMMKTFNMRSVPNERSVNSNSTAAVLTNPLPTSDSNVHPSISSHNRLRPPDEQKIEELRTRLGLPLEITSGQRHLGPSPDWGGPPPTNEIFIGHLPYDIFEDELIPLFERFGHIYDARIMLDPSGQFSPPPGHKGFAFINFVERSAAEHALKEMNGYEIRGKKMKVNPSFQNTRLFIGNLPKNKSKEEIHQEIRKSLEGCVDVIVYADINDERVKNRGFCFADFDCHKNASSARRRFMTFQTVLFGRTVVADWADPIQEPDEAVMSKVKVLYVKNLRDGVTEEQLAQKASEFGPLEKCKKIKDYAFVTYKEREHAVSALRALNGFLMGGIPLDVTLARPQTEEYNKKKEERKKQLEILTANARAHQSMPNAPYNYGYETPMAPQQFRGGGGRGGVSRGGGGGRGNRGGGGPRGGGPTSRGGRGGRGVARGIPPPVGYPPRMPPQPISGEKPAPYGGYGGYTGGYADNPSVDYYPSPYEGYDYGQAVATNPPPPLYPPPLTDSGAPPPTGYGGYTGGYAHPAYPGYESYDYSASYGNGAGAYSVYGAPRPPPPHGGRGKMPTQPRGSPVSRGASQGRGGVKRPTPPGSNSGGRGAANNKQAKMAHPPPLYPGVAPPKPGMMDPGNGYAEAYDHSANGSQITQQQWYSNNFSDFNDGWQ